MNIIIAGCGKVGRALAEQLSKEKHDITVIDLKPESIQLVTNAADVRGVVGNGASYDIQMDAGVDKADLMIAVTNADEVNLLCCLLQKKQEDARPLPEYVTQFIITRFTISKMNWDCPWSLIRNGQQPWKWRVCYGSRQPLTLILLQTEE